ncbi:MAG: hypothetical protein RR649_03070, partial [Carnobacterium sp.]
PGSASPLAGFAVMFAYNPAGKVLIAALACMVVSTLSGFLGSYIFRNFKIKTADQIRSGNINVKDTIKESSKIKEPVIAKAEF